MAADWFASGGRTRDRVTVAGDARRGAIWHATFVRDAVSPRQETNWTVSPIENFLLNIPADTPVLTIDKKRLAAILGERLPCDLIEATPSAVMLARLARNLASAGISTERLEPIYAHPPV
jgi:tRNA A37 threonylcarbamoyladenosine modification protein TsaB